MDTTHHKHRALYAQQALCNIPKLRRWTRTTTTLCSVVARCIRSKVISRPMGSGRVGEISGYLRNRGSWFALRMKWKMKLYNLKLRNCGNSIRIDRQYVTVWWRRRRNDEVIRNKPCVFYWPCELCACVYTIGAIFSPPYVYWMSPWKSMHMNNTSHMSFVRVCFLRTEKQDYSNHCSHSSEISQHTHKHTQTHAAQENETFSGIGSNPVPTTVRCQLIRSLKPTDGWQTRCHFAHCQAALCSHKLCEHITFHWMLAVHTHTQTFVI